MRIDTIAEIEQAEIDRKIADKAAELRSQGKFEDAKLLIVKESLKKEKKAAEKAQEQGWLLGHAR